MLTPEGQSGDNTDKIMLLAMWANTLKNEAIDGIAKSMISAGMGKPTYPINMHTVEMYLNYWRAIEALLIQAQSLSEVEMASAALDYGDARGDSVSRNMMAEAMTCWYQSAITPDNILFTVGGSGALRVIFETLNELYHDIPSYRVITPFPHYTLYVDNRHKLHPIDVMREPGYQLTAKSLQISIQSAIKLAEKDNNLPKVVLLCNPSNPLGTVISEVEWMKIANVLRQYPDLTLVIDEAYAEMYWDGSKISSVLHLAPDLKERTIILRSATKALSAAGERMAMLMAFNPALMAKLRNKNISTIGHAPRSAQLAYAHTMVNFNITDHESLKNYYKPKVDFVYKKLQELGVCMPDPLYKVEGAFYVLGDFSDLFGMEIPLDAKRALDKTGKVTTNEELAYYLLFKESIMLAPGSYFGLPPNSGFMRITCSGTNDELNELMSRLENCLLQARQLKAEQLMKEITAQLTVLSLSDTFFCQSIQEKISQIMNNNGDCFALKNQNEQLTSVLSSIKVHIYRATPEGRASAGRVIYTFLNDVAIRRKELKAAEDLKIQWKMYINETVSEGSLKNYLLNLNEAEKASFKPWIEHLNTISQKHNSSEPGI